MKGIINFKKLDKMNASFSSVHEIFKWLKLNIMKLRGYNNYK